MKPGSPPSPRFLRLRRRIRHRPDRRRHHARAAQFLRHDLRRGRRRNALRRSGAKAGDEIWVSGRPGRAALGLAHLQGGRLDEPAAPTASPPCNGRSRASRSAWRLRGLATSAIDVSDGLLADLGHILEQSGLAARLQIAVPQRRLLNAMPGWPAATTTNWCLPLPLRGTQIAAAVAGTRSAADPQIGVVEAGPAGKSTCATPAAPKIHSRPPRLRPFSGMIPSMAKLPAAVAEIPDSTTRRTWSPAAFGSGLSRWAPGTAGTAFAWLTYPFLRMYLESDLGFAIFLLLAFAVGVAACQITGRALGVVDHGAIVWDEIVPFWAC
jgi:hypothetical protein